MNSISRSIELVIENGTEKGTTRTMSGYVTEEMDELLRKSASHGLSKKENQAIREEMMADGEVDEKEGIAAYALAAAAMIGEGRIRSVRYIGSDYGSDFSLPLHMHATTAKEVIKDLRADLKSVTSTAQTLSVLDLLKGHISRQSTLDSTFKTRADQTLATELRDELIYGGKPDEKVDEISDEKIDEIPGEIPDETPSEIPNRKQFTTDQSRFLIDRINDAPYVGQETMALVLDILKSGSFEDKDDWYSLRGALQERYSSDLANIMPPNAIVAELYRLSARFAKSQNSISAEEGAKLLAIGLMQGIPTPDVRRALVDILDIYDDVFTAKAQTAMRATLEGLPHGEKKEWTMFVYMASDNDLEEFGQEDVNEMERRFGDVAEFMNVVVLVDGTKEWVGNQPAYNWTSKTRLLKISADKNRDDRSIVSKEIPIPRNSDLGALMRKGSGELNMGSGKTMSSALEFVTEAFPSDKLFVDIWNHGNATTGIAWDDSTPGGDDALRMNELSEALKSSNRKIDILGFDACLMQNFGVAANMLSADVDYILASEELEPSDGWAYDAAFARLGKEHAQNGEISAKAMSLAMV
ncbi:hypothetical protein KAI87_12025, partial [Myxococcota bacterium]|nr:hypothetical protein [Myxococcota bacterium]